MEYSKLVDAVNEHDRTKCDQLLRQIMPKVVKYLRMHWNAGKQDAEDCAQDAIITVLNFIEEKKLRDPEQVFNFLLTIAKNNYLNLCKTERTDRFHEINIEYQHQPRQLLSIINEEDRNVLEKCLEQLSESYRKFIDYWFSYPGSGSKAASTHFGISINNVWTRKYRVIKKLSDCYQKKSENQV